MTTRYLFDTGPEGTTLTQANTGVSSIIIGTGATATFAGAKAAHGGFGAKFVGTNVATIARIATESSSNQQAVSFVWTSPIAATPSGVFLTFFTARAASAVIWRLQWKDGNPQLLDGNNVYYVMKSGSTNVVLSLNTQYRFEVITTVGSTTAGAVTVNCYTASGSLVGTISTTSASFGTSPMVAFDCGLQAGVSTSMELGYDDVQNSTGATSEIGAYSPGANVAPVVSASSSQSTTVPNATVTLNGTASDSDGTIASVKWDFTSVPTGVTAPTISNSTSNTGSFTPTTAGIYVARFTATDNSGSSTSASVTIYVGGTTVSVVSTTSNTGMWTVTPTGSTATTVLSDSDATTYVESPPSPSAAAPERLRLGPMQPQSTFQLTVGTPTVVGTGNLAFTVSLYEGSTLRKQWTGVAAAGADVNLTMTSAECGAIVSWNTLDVELSVTAA